jgi:hypothetical protein
MLSETDMPRSAEADLTEPFRALLNRAMLVVLKRRSGRCEVSNFDEIRQDSKHFGQEPSFGGTILSNYKFSFFGDLPFDMQGWRRDGFCDHGVEAAHVQTVEVLGWDNEGDVAIERLSLVLQFEATPARYGYGCRTMKVREVFCFSPLSATSCCDGGL